jgi:hypothetical protein
MDVEAPEELPAWNLAHVAFNDIGAGQVPPAARQRNALLTVCSERPTRPLVDLNRSEGPKARHLKAQVESAAARKDGNNAELVRRGGREYPSFATPVHDRAA